MIPDCLSGALGKAGHWQLATAEMDAMKCCWVQPVPCLTWFSAYALL